MEESKVVATEIVPKFLQMKQRSLRAAGDASSHQALGSTVRHLTPHIDRKTADRIVQALVEEEHLIMVAVPDPFSARSSTKSHGRSLRLLALPDINADSAEVSALLHTIKQFKSWDSYVHKWRAVGASVCACAHTLGSSWDRKSQGPLHDHLRTGIRSETGDECCSYADLPTESLKLNPRAGDIVVEHATFATLAVRMGYVPGLASRAQRLQAVLVEWHMNAMDQPVESTVGRATNSARIRMYCQH